ncbi:MAG: HAD-IC family P-type ATPase, partial [Burkholderiaceae bacterium]|nr:HAD-IC family P-type ATPase [Burkholderiaceae bacterium]
CPCALSLATPAAMLASAGALARGGVLVRRLSALEALARAATVVFDKTGTLTRDAFVLERIALRPGADRAQTLAWAAALARSSLHPLSRALAQAPEMQDARAEAVRVTAEQSGAGVMGAVAGGAEIRLGSVTFTGAGDHAEPGLAVYLADQAGWLATFCLKEDVRADAAETVARLRGQGMRVCVYSGDRPEAAARLGQALGVDESRGGLSPDDKLATLRVLQAAGHRVAMVGDGLNDAPVLAGADVSFAFGRAVPIARSRSDFVVLTKQLLTVADTLAQARRTLRIVRQNLAWAAVYNLVAVPLAIAGYMPAWAAGFGMAASSLLVVLNALRLAGKARPIPNKPVGIDSPTAKKVA